MKKRLVICLVVIFILILIGIVTCLFARSWYYQNLEPVNSVENGESIEVEIEKGTVKIKIAEILENKKIIKNAMAFNIYLKFNNINNLQAGKYVFNNGKDDVKKIVEKMSKGEVKDDSVTITLIEGKKITDYAKIISEKTNHNMEEIFNLLNNEEFINSIIDKYWFITDEIKNEDIYYPLEGYLKPDTYIFENKDVSLEYIFNSILNYTDKFLSNYKEKIENSSFSVHEILTFASVVEKESYKNEDMSGVAGVFYNRLNNKMSLGSDVTTYYAFQVELSESDLTSTQINSYNPYNTRGPNMNGKLPVGPICSPSKFAIEAVLNPENSDNFYFVSDKNGNTYFTKNYNEHTKLVKKLKDEGLWFTY